MWVIEDFLEILLRWKTIIAILHAFCHFFIIEIWLHVRDAIPSWDDSAIFQFSEYVIAAQVIAAVGIPPEEGNTLPAFESLFVQS